VADRSGRITEFTRALGSGRAGRAGNHPRCEGCGLHVELCLCSEIAPLTVKTRVVLLSHLREVRKPTNTGRLLALALGGCELRIRGFMDREALTAKLECPERRSLLLFPSADALILGPELLAADPRPITLVVPDGTWRQARKVVVREPALGALERVSLPPGPPSRYRLRHDPDPERLSTFEAVARIIGLIDGPVVQRSLEHILDVMVERTLWTRGELRSEDIRHGLPEAARRWRAGGEGS